MLILLEGPDGSGKSSLARTIAGLTGGTLVKRDSPEFPGLIEYTADLGAYQPGGGVDIICDRWHIGELVYGPLYRGGCSMSPTAWRAVEEFLADRGAVLVHVEAPVDTLVERLTLRGEEVNRDQLAAEWFAFRQAFKRTRLVSTKYYTTAGPDGIAASQDAMARRIIQLANEEEHHAVTAA